MLIRTQFDRTRDMWMTGTKKNREMHNACISFLEREVKDPTVREKLRSTSEFGCKRVLFMDDWYSLFNNSNVELITEGPVRITSGAIVSKPPHALDQTDRALDPVGAYLEKAKDGPTEEVLRDIDVLIWGTGFDMNDSGGHFNIFGENGALLSQT
ncbi:FAD-binding monooxygenase BOA2 [Fusarium oxysporum f. sp. raphani]|uniref:FAD-binding monooxygenase BOA2 n=1 Tax=Fusarium oxysporum f. sp. raphani TaxID=96318 RepID=A0A8J5PGV9_FUSOX|nr:FAD-binding monooxygenase BOA2 [Fusarium oxysporum f. sp. raphani]